MEGDSMADPQIWFKIGDGDEFDPTAKIKGLRFLGIDHTSASPQWTNTYNDQPGLDGSPFAFQTLAKRTLTARFTLLFGDYADYTLARHDIYQLFSQRKSVRVRTDMSPDKVFFAYVTPFEIAPIQDGANYANIAIPFDVPNGVYFSRFRSDSSNTEVQFGMNVLAGEEPAYQFTSTAFRVYNDSDIAVDPYHQRHELKIKIKFSGDKFNLKNTTNGTAMAYNKAVGGSALVWDGQSLTWFKDGTNDNVNADDGYITLDPGWNDFTVGGASGVDITFSFPFIYLL